MKKNKFLFGFVLMILVVLTTSFVLATPEYPMSANIISYWTLDDAQVSGNTVIDLEGNKNGTNDGATSGATCKVNECYTFANDGTPAANEANHIVIGLIGNMGGDHTFVGWVREATGSSNSALFSQGRTDGTNFVDSFFRAYSAEGYSRYDVKAGGAAQSATTTNYIFNDYTWYFVSYVFNDSSNAITIYVDGVVNATGTQTNSLGAFDNFGLIGGYYANAAAHWSAFNGNMDEIIVFNKSLSINEVQDLYNSGSGLNWTQVYASASASSVNPPTFISPTPANNSHNLTQANITSECDSGNTSIIWFNSSYPPTSQVANASGNASYITVGNDSTYYYTSGCYDGAIGYSENTTTRTWVYDTTQPQINLNPTNSFNTNNYSNDNQYDNTMRLNFSMVDNIALYGMLVNITKDGTIYYNVTNVSLSGTTWLFDKELDTTLWGVGTYNIQIMASDSHTAKQIPNYQVTKKKSSITFKTPNDNNIKIETNDASTITTNKVVDRYTFNMNFDDGLTKDRTFRVKTDKCELDYIENSDYKAHFVSYCDGSGNWIDFEGSGDVLEVNRLDDYDYEVVIADVPASVTFNSIGGLNINEVNYTWYRGSVTSQTVSALASENSLIRINTTHDPSTIKNITAWLSYNNTNYLTVSRVNYTDSYLFNQSLTAPNATLILEYTWNITVTQLDDATTNFLKSYNQSIEFFGIDSCIASNVTVLHFWIRDENIPTNLLTGDFEWITYSTYEDPTNVQTDFDNLTGSTNYTLCIFPTYANFTLDGYFKYTVSGGYTHRYYLINHSTTNSSQNISLYNWNNTGASDLKITTRNSNDYNQYSNVVGVLQRWYISENLWRSVQMDKSGEFGTLFFNVIEQNTDYRLVYFDADGNVLKTTDASKFVCTTNFCDLTQLLDPYSATTSTSSINGQFTYSNTTKIITATWSSVDATDKTVTMFVSRAIGTGNILVCNQTQTGAGGVMTCNMTGFSGTAYAVLDVEGNSYTISEFISLVRSTIQDYVSRLDGVFFTFGIVATIALAAVFSPVAAIMATVIGVVAASYLGFMSGFPMVFIIGTSILAILISVRVKR